MIQNVSDFLSFIVLLAIPCSFVVGIIYNRMKAKNKEIQKSEEKYYREW
ncbi:MAG: hypothetical protein ACRCZJ_02030 [Erysipelotrichaceae bacterium]